MKLIQPKIEKVNAYCVSDLKDYFKYIAEYPEVCDFLIHDIIITNNNHNVKESLNIKADFKEKGEDPATYNLFLYNDGKALGDVKYLYAEGNQKYNVTGKHYLKRSNLLILINEHWENNLQSESYIIEIPLLRPVVKEFSITTFKNSKV